MSAQSVELARGQWSRPCCAFDPRYGRFVGGFGTFAGCFRGFGHRLAPLRQESGSFQGVKTIATALFSWEFAFFDHRCQTPVFGQVHPRLEIPLVLHFGRPPTDHSDAFLPGFSAVHHGGSRPKHLPIKHRRHGSGAQKAREPCPRPISRSVPPVATARGGSIPLQELYAMHGQSQTRWTQLIYLTAPSVLREADTEDDCPAEAGGLAAEASPAFRGADARARCPASTEAWPHPERSGETAP